MIISFRHHFVVGIKCVINYSMIFPTLHLPISTNKIRSNIGQGYLQFAPIFVIYNLSPTCLAVVCWYYYWIFRLQQRQTFSKVTFKWCKFLPFLYSQKGADLSQLTVVRRRIFVWLKTVQKCRDFGIRLMLKKYPSGVLLTLNNAW